MATLGPEQRAALARLADTLIPAGEGHPSASQAGVAGQWVDRVLEVRPDMFGDLISLLRAVEDREPVQAVQWLRARPGTWFDTLAEVVAGAYFLNPKVRRLLGYSGQRRIPIKTSIEELQQLTAPVVERGHIYRPCS